MQQPYGAARWGCRGSGDASCAGTPTQLFLVCADSRSSVTSNESETRLQREDCGGEENGD
jgi:hypothetical protein